MAKENEDDLDLEVEEEEAQETEVELDEESEDETEVEAESEDDQETEEEEEEELPEPSEDEKDGRPNFGKEAQKRISKLTRQRKEAEERAAQLEARIAALEQESTTSKTQLTEYQRNQVQQFEDNVAARESGLKSAADAAQRKLRVAIADEDVDAQIEAQSELASVAAQQAQLSAVKSQWERQKQAYAAQSEEKEKSPKAPEVQEETREMTPAQQRSHAAGQKWIQRNRDWLEESHQNVMTAFGVHRDLLDEGYNPEGSASDMGEYYVELTNRMKKLGYEAKHLDAKMDKEKPKSIVAGRSRTAGGKGKKKVKLTQSEVQMARELGVTLEDYAREKENIERERAM